MLASCLVLVNEHWSCHLVLATALVETLPGSFGARFLYASYDCMRTIQKARAPPPGVTAGGAPRGPSGVGSYPPARGAVAWSPGLTLRWRSLSGRTAVVPREPSILIQGN